MRRADASTLRRVAVSSRAEATVRETPFDESLESGVVPPQEPPGTAPACVVSFTDDDEAADTERAPTFGVVSEETVSRIPNGPARAPEDPAVTLVPARRPEDPPVTLRSRSR
jgi:hypothetical protein